MAEDFSKYLIKDYKYWSVFIFTNQSYLGRCVVWCNRKDAFDLTDVTLEEQGELLSILRDLKSALSKLFKPDWFNYSFLGNETRHLHCHFIPRYAGSRNFMDVTFEDKLYGHSYKTDHNFAIPESVLETIRKKIKGVL